MMRSAPPEARRRRSPSRVFKCLGNVTTFNGNTAWSVGPGPRFRDGPAARQLIADFDRRPPAYVVYSPSMVQTFGAAVEPLRQFTALDARLRRDYVPEAQYGDLTLLRRRSPAPPRSR